MSDWIDISMPLVAGMPQWPGDPVFTSWKVADIAHGGEANVTAMSLCAHTGTHVDAPLHYIANGADVSLLALDVFLGPARVIAAEEQWPRAERLLFRSGNGELSPGQARQAVENGVRLVGIDSLSIGNTETHRILLDAGVIVLEGLDLSQVADGEYELVCLPLRLIGADGAPARAALRRR